MCSIHVKGCCCVDVDELLIWAVMSDGHLFTRLAPVRCGAEFISVGSLVLSVPLEPAPNLEINMRSTQNYRHLEPQRGKQFGLLFLHILFKQLLGQVIYCYRLYVTFCC